MEQMEIEQILDSFQIIADTREHNTPRAKKRFQAFGVPVKRATLNYGDYTWNCCIDGNEYYNTSGRLSPACVIERKMSLDELAGNLTRGRKRFQREFERAAINGAKVYLLVENANWESIMMHRYRSKYHPKAFLSSLTAWMVRYNITPVFCRSETSGDLIKEILYRDLKERLARGEHG